MFCPNCGSNVPEGSNNCGNCGAAVASNPQPDTVPQYAQVPPYTPQPQVNAVSKSKFISTIASAKVKTFSLVAIVVALIYAAVMVGGYFFTLESSVEDIPVVATAADIADADLDEIEDLKDEVDEYIEELEDIIDEREDELSSKERKAVKKLLDVMEEFTDTISINGLTKAMNVMEDVVDSDIDLDDDTIEDFEDLQDGVGIALGIIKFVILFSMLFALLFVVLGGICKVRGLVIAGLIFSIFHTAIFCGPIFIVAAVLLCAVLIYLLSVINSEYKKYRLGEMNY